ncbi:hypothetical protein BDD12DRAFT_817041 [Trichophaea hybrida]|nr:hypothetical protein BDD12DRAFT_817041 [Trichophaea hybrida]
MPELQGSHHHPHLECLDTRRCPAPPLHQYQRFSSLFHHPHFPSAQHRRHYSIHFVPTKTYAPPLCSTVDGS